jgi:histone acetyltransferase (RNA polymerase elongator complex component)
MSFYEDIIKLILTDSIQSKKSLHNKKMKLCKKYGLSHIP